MLFLDDRPPDAGHDGAVPDPEHRLPENPVYSYFSSRWRRIIAATAHTATSGASGPGTTADTIQFNHISLFYVVFFHFHFLALPFSLASLNVFL